MLQEKEDLITTDEQHRKADLKKGYGAAIFFSVLVGFSFLGIKVCQSFATSLNILCYRYDFGLLAMILLIVFGIVTIDIRHKPKKMLLLTAGFYVAFMAFQVTGLAWATSVEGSIFFAIVPILVKIIASVFLGEKSTWIQNLFIAMTVVALIVMIVMGAGSVSLTPLSVILLFLSSVCMAINNVLMRYVRNDYTPIEITFTIIVMGFVLFHIAAIVSGIVTGSGLAGYFQPLKHPQVLIAGIYLGVGCILLSAHLMSYMQSKMEAVKASLFGNVSTAISIVAGVVFLGETLQWYHILCTILIIAGVVGLNLSGRRKKEDAEQ